MLNKITFDEQFLKKNTFHYVMFDQLHLKNFNKLW